MPIYEYRCGSCSHELDALQKISDSQLRKCPACGKLTLRRLISAPVFRLKGGGWYETDFKGDGDKKRNLVETSPNESSSRESSGSESTESSKSADSAKSEAPAKADGAAKETKKPATKPGASEVKKPRKSRAAGPTRT
jgi:putative FmdB family regulatory protein